MIISLISCSTRSIWKFGDSFDENSIFLNFVWESQAKNISAHIQVTKNFSLLIEITFFIANNFWCSIKSNSLRKRMISALCLSNHLTLFLRCALSNQLDFFKIKVCKSTWKKLWLTRLRTHCKLWRRTKS